MADRVHHGPASTPRETGASTGPRDSIVEGVAGRRTHDPSGWLIVRRDGTVVTAERSACELLGAPDPDALAGRDWLSILAAPDAADARAVSRTFAVGGTWEGTLHFRYARVEVALAASVAPVARSSELMVMSLEPASVPEALPAHPADAPAHASLLEVDHAPVMSREDLRAVMAAYDAQHDLTDPAAIAHAVLQAIDGAIGFDWAAVLRYVPQATVGVEVVATYPTPIAGIERGVHWTTAEAAEAAEALVYDTGEPSMHGDVRPPTPSMSPLSRLPAFGLRSRILIPLFAGAGVAGALALYRNGLLAFTASEGIRGERIARRLGEALAAKPSTAALLTVAQPPAAVPAPTPPTEPTPPDKVAPTVVTPRLESLGELVAGVAHELNNPLTAILGYAQILGGLEGIEREHALHTIEDEAQRAARIVRNLLSFARQRPGQRRPVNLKEVLRRVIDLRRYALEVDNVHVTTRLGLVPEVEVDEGQFEQVFLNLLSNAQQALQERGGEIVISTWQDGDRIYITFGDSGPGIPEELRARIFEPFFTTREVGSGQGMGLAIVYGVVTHHGGRTWVEENPQGGATFVIELPLSAADVASEESGASAGSSTPPAVPAPRASERVLVVDDEAPVRALTTAILGASGYRVESAADGDTALRLLASETFDLIITDLKMPGMDGASLFRHIVQEWPEMEHRVLFVTGDIEGEPAARSLDTASICYLEKPFTTRQLIAAVRGILDSQAARPLRP